MTIDEGRLVGFALLVVVFGTAVAAGPALAGSSFDPGSDRQLDRPLRSVATNQVNVSVPGGDEGGPLPLQQEDTPTETTTDPSTETTTESPTGTSPDTATGTDTTTPAETEPSTATATTTETDVPEPTGTETATDAELTTEGPSPTGTDTSGARFGADAPGDAPEPDDPLLRHDVILMGLGIVGSVVVAVIGIYGVFLADS